MKESATLGPTYLGKTKILCAVVGGEVASCSSSRKPRASPLREGWSATQKVPFINTEGCLLTCNYRRDFPVWVCWINRLLVSRSVMVSVSQGEAQLRGMCCSSPVSGSH